MLHYLTNRDCGRVCSRKGRNPLRRTPHGLTALTKYDLEGGQFTTLWYCPPRWPQRSLVRSREQRGQLPATGGSGNISGVTALTRRYTGSKAMNLVCCADDRAI